MRVLPIAGSVAALALAAGCGGSDEPARQGAAAPATTQAAATPVPPTATAAEATPGEPVSLRPGDRARAGTTRLSCIAGPRRSVGCGFGSGGKYAAGSVAVGLDARRAVVVGIAHGDTSTLFVRDHPGGPLEVGGPVAAGSRRSFTLQEGESATLHATTIRCVMVEAAAFVCGSYVDGFEAGTMAVSIDRDRAGALRISHSGEAKPLFRRRHPAGRQG